MRSISNFISESDSSRINITVNTNVYCLAAIHEATYKYTDSYHILIISNTDDSVTIIFEMKEKAKDALEDIKEFANTLIDHQIRIQLEKTNGRIRDLIVTHAFSPLDLKKEVDTL